MKTQNELHGNAQMIIYYL